MSRSSPKELAARLGRIQPLIHDLAQTEGSPSPVARAIADKITRQIEAVRRELVADPTTHDKDRG